MPRRRALTEAQLERLLALPTAEPDLVRHWTLGAADLAAVERRRGDHNRLGFALQLCAFRYPAGCFAQARASRSRRCASSPSSYASMPKPSPTTPSGRRPGASSSTPCALPSVFGGSRRSTAEMSPRGCCQWRLPQRMRRRSRRADGGAAPAPDRRAGPERARAPCCGRDAAARAACRPCSSPAAWPPAQTAALEELLGPKEGAPTSVLAWARRPPGAPAHDALARPGRAARAVARGRPRPRLHRGRPPGSPAPARARGRALHRAAPARPIAASPPRHPGRHRARHHRAPDRRRRRPVRPRRRAHVPPRRGRASRTPFCATPARSTTRCASSPSSARR